MNYTARMVALLGALRREMNGAVVEAMRFHGKSYGLNYGVSLPTIRQIARAEAADHDFARYLYLQDVRELRLAALSIADPGRVTAEELDEWAAGIINTEVAAEAALLLLSRLPDLTPLLGRWVPSDNPLLVYAALLSAARSARPAAAWLGPVARAVERHAGERPVAEAAVALLSALAQHDECRPAVIATIDSLTDTPAACYIREEMEWRLTF